MAFICRVLAAAKIKKVLRPQFVEIPRKFQTLLICNYSSASDSLLSRLLEVPNSRIKSVLDSEEKENPTLRSHGFSWDSLVTRVRSSSPDKVLPILEWRLDKVIKDNEKNDGQYTELISLCGKIQNIPLAMRVFTSMEAHGIKPTSSVFTALINACLASGNLVTAISLFEIMEHSESYKPNSDTYNAFLSAYANWGNDKAMQAMFLAKKAAGFSADLDAYEFLILGCFKSKNFDGAEKFCDEMMLSGVTPNIQILEIMLKVFSERSNYSKIKELLNFMLNGGWEINAQIAEKLVGSFVKLGRVEDMEELLQTLTNLNAGAEVLSWVHYGVIRMYAMSDRLDDLEFSVGRMMKGRISFKFADDIEKVICAYFRLSAYDRLDLFLKHITDSYKLTRSTYDLLIAGYKRAGLSEKLDKLMEDGQLAGVL